MTMAALKSLEPLRLLAARSRWRPAEIAFWSLVVASYFLFPGYLVLISQILVAGLFALSLDLMLGYGGMPSLGHAAFFGLGAYAAGLLGQLGWGEPISGLLLSGAVAGVFGLLCSLFLSRLRTTAFLMVTLTLGLLLREFANRWSGLTGGDDRLRRAGSSQFRTFGRGPHHACPRWRRNAVRRVRGGCRVSRRTGCPVRFGPGLLVLLAWAHHRHGGAVCQ